MQRTIYFDYLRVIACFAVIVLHVSAMQIQNYSVPTIEWNVINLYDSATRFCVPVFLMISGALFLNPEKQLSLRRLYTHYIFRIVIAFIFWSFIYACYVFTPNEEPSFLTLFLWGHVHMWFLWLIVGLYMLVPILRAIVLNRLVMEYFLSFSLLLCYVFPFVFELIKLFVNPLLPMVELGEMCFDKLHLQLFSGYTFFFVLGHYLHTTHLKRNIENILIVLGSFATICIAVFTSLLFKQSDHDCDLFKNNETFLVAIQSVTVFLIIKRIGNTNSKIVNSISQHSFGIYLIHMLIYYMLGLTTITVNPIISIPLVSILVFLVSYMIVIAISRIPILSKWLI